MTILDAVYMIENDISLKGSAHKLIEGLALDVIMGLIGKNFAESFFLT